jgi:hypothetical protein
MIDNREWISTEDAVSLLSDTEVNIHQRRNAVLLSLNESKDESVTVPGLLQPADGGTTYDSTMASVSSMTDSDGAPS